MHRGVVVGLCLFVLAARVAAGEADIVDVKVQKTGDNTYRFDVTVAHGDEDWDHYADRWDVVTPDGQVLNTRILHHPHVHEQPFTRSLSGVIVTDSLPAVILRAHDSVHGYGGRTATVELPR